jgi:hypothetical protein
MRHILWTGKGSTSSWFLRIAEGRGGTTSMYRVGSGGTGSRSAWPENLRKLTGTGDVSCIFVQGAAGRATISLGYGVAAPA